MPNFESLNLDEQPLDPQQLLRLRGPRPQSQGGLGVIEKTLSSPDFWSTQPDKPANVSSPVKPDPKTGQGPFTDAVAGSEHRNPGPSQDARSSGSGDEPTPSIPSGSGPSGGLGSTDIPELHDSRPPEDPIRQPSLPPPGGANKPGDFTQADPVSGSPAKPADDERKDLEKKIEKSLSRDPSALAKEDLGPAPQEANLGAMGYLGPALAMLLGGPHAFAGAAEGVAGVVKDRHQEVVDYKKQLSDLTAKYRASKSTDERAYWADKIKWLKDQEQSQLNRGKLELQQIHEEHLNAHWQAMQELGKLKLDMNEKTSTAHNQVLRDIAELRVTETAKEFEQKLDILKQHQADFHLQVASQIGERARANDIRQQMEGIAARRLDIDQAKGVATNLKSIIDTITTSIASLERSKSNLRRNDPRNDQINKQIEELKAQQKELQKQFDAANSYKGPQGNLPQGAVPSSANPNDKLGNMTLAEIKQHAQEAKNKPDAARLRQMFPGITDAQIQFILGK